MYIESGKHWPSSYDQPRQNIILYIILVYTKYLCFRCLPKKKKNYFPRDPETETYSIVTPEKKKKM